MFDTYNIVLDALAKTLQLYAKHQTGTTGLFDSAGDKLALVVLFVFGLGSEMP